MGISQYVNRLINRYQMASYQKKLAKQKHYQKEKFDRIKLDFNKIYTKLKKYDIQKYLTDPWNEFNSTVEQQVLPTPSFSFLMNAVIKKTMFLDEGGKGLDYQLSFLEKELSKSELKYLLEEDYIGDPSLRIPNI